MIKVIICILSFLGIISTLCLIFAIKASKAKTEYINFLEKEYINFIDLLNKIDNEAELKKIIKKSKTTSLYKYAKHWQSNNPLITDMINQSYYGDNKHFQDKT